MQCPDGQSLAQAQQGVRPIGHASCLIGGAHVVVRPSHGRPSHGRPSAKSSEHYGQDAADQRGQPDFGSTSTV
jgi:hypothetical protein